MRKLKLTPARQRHFLKALSESGSVSTAAAVAGTSRTRVYELRKADPAFAAAWDEAEEIATDRLEEEARRRALEGVSEPLVSAGKLVRGDDGKPIMIQRYSDRLLAELLRARRPPPRERSLHFHLPVLHSMADAADAMASIAAAVAAGGITPGEAGELSRLVEAYMRAINARQFVPQAAIEPIEHSDVDAKAELIAELARIRSRLFDPPAGGVANGAAGDADGGGTAEIPDAAADREA